MTREEATERIKTRFDKWALDDKDMKAIQTLIPEIAESENERIRKDIIEYLKLVGKGDGDYAQPMIDRWIAYLEKQKEQKPILEVFGFKVGDAVRLKDGDGRKHIIKSFEEVEGLHGPNFYHVEFEDNSARSGIYPGEEYPNGYYTQMEKFEKKQKPANDIDMDVSFTTNDGQSKLKAAGNVYDNIHNAMEQKTVEIQDYSVLNGLERAIHRGFLSTGVENVPVTIIKETAQDCLAQMRPAERSEEDETMINHIIEALPKWANGLITILPSQAEEYVKRLKSLRPQPKQGLSIEKAIQWFDDTFYFLDNSSGRGRDCEITTYDFDSLEEMYDSFRKAVIVDSEPSWKPSEEQILAIVEALKYLPNNKDEWMILDTLINVLKKLK